MIICKICGDQSGPWTSIKDIGFVCENCIRKSSKIRKTKKLNRHLQKEVKDHEK